MNEELDAGERLFPVEMGLDTYEQLDGVAQGYGLPVELLCARAIALYRFQWAFKRTKLVVVHLHTVELESLRGDADRRGIPAIEQVFAAVGRERENARDPNGCLLVVRDPQTRGLSFLSYPPMLDIGGSEGSRGNSDIRVSEPLISASAPHRVTLTVAMRPATYQAIQALTGNWTYNGLNVLARGITIYRFLDENAG